ncbi:MarR family transcriptional regulator [Flavobacteriaceae bacterium]|jgi:DNA-binding MarR family transcriptional regulator|nr:MarR family transcriptional regulator [Flavobacteriaceae bacterium]MDB4027382.1 MarR family transcriptional regulator [bacterium]MBT5283756.1 MarR family transcriptional regulator [Flavobacteriaceae bacterium]MBT5447303.1 MarR family transcriptional regulator [Flavobacteriaceae bacterium]MBT5693252.1 MarR family transcriptional regulator [Flavobacteriaceae bacterium]|tara:strand:+ start:326 stop:775 length:450 start_codon:yes stop_codon:yes gene_type:complete
MRHETFESALRSTWQLVSKMYSKEALQFDSTMAMGFALLSIDSEGTPSTNLGPKMGMEPTSLSRLLNAMEERGLINRIKNPNDGRGVLIHLTPEGKKHRENSKAVVLDFNEKIDQQLTQQQVQHFFEVIECIRETTSNFKHFNTTITQT